MACQINQPGHSWFSSKRAMQGLICNVNCRVMVAKERQMHLLPGQRALRSWHAKCLEHQVNSKDPAQWQLEPSNMQPQVQSPLPLCLSSLPLPPSLTNQHPNNAHQHYVLTASGMQMLRFLKSVVAASVVQVWSLSCGRGKTLHEVWAKPLREQPPGPG